MLLSYCWVTMLLVVHELSIKNISVSAYGIHPNMEGMFAFNHKIA